MSHQTAAAAFVRPARSVRGTLHLPGDKSISHRYAMLAALADGRSTIRGYSTGADCAATLACLRALGVEASTRRPTLDPDPGDRPGLTIEIIGRGVRGLQAPAGPLDAQNSGTTLRLLAGILAAHPFMSVIDGDASLRRRPMRRVMDPLERMGAHLDAVSGRPPLTIRGAPLQGFDYTLPIPSAQVKSAILLAGLQADGRTVVREPTPTRNHTELALAAFGVEIERDREAISVTGGQRLRGTDVRVPGDVSSGAFWAAAACALPGSDVELVGVGLNPSRTALLDVLRRMGGRVEATIEEEPAGEPIGAVRVRHGHLEPVTLTPADVPGLIDELPVLAALSTHGGALTVTGAEELRAKESDRITALVEGLRGLGADVDELPDGFVVRGTRRLRGGVADAAGDHRLAMAFAIAALGATGPSTITGADAVQISYPGFFEILASICA